MKRGLILAGGVLNSLFALFHVFLSWQIHHISGVAPDIKALLEMFALGGTLMIFFFAFASLLCPTDLLTTRLGRLVIGLIAAVYLSRAAEETLLAVQFSPVIFWSCLLVGVIYVVALVAPRGQAQA
jgi:hypothetical protein